MDRRFPGSFLTSLGALSGALAIAVVPLISQAPSGGQNAAVAASGYMPPRTPWGDPDLQGMWPGNMGVPMQRPIEFGERTLLTDAEFARRQAQAQAQAKADAEIFVSNSGGPGGLGGPTHWAERGRPTRQASLIIDPP